ncbi:extracellular solute-binding protein [Streptococcus pneumoniae]|nr:extracellular solute-binding protein [Streptococcus pneumoniae]
MNHRNTAYSIFFISNFYKLILFENQIQTTSASPYRTQVQPAASFLVCTLIFIEYYQSQCTFPASSHYNSAHKNGEDGNPLLQILTSLQTNYS